MIDLLPTRDARVTQFARVSIRIVGDCEMSDLHQRYSNVEGTTDVLTFVQTDSHGGLEVDLALCCDEAQRRSQEFGHSVENELALYAIHGLLHSIGFDDRDPTQATHMHREEDRILTSIGIGAVFAPRRGES